MTLYRLKPGQPALEHFAFENALQAMRRHGLPQRRRRRNSLAPSTPEQASYKQSALETVDGRLAGRRFEPGQAYAEIPAGCQARFERIELRPASPSQSDQSVKKPGKRPAGGDA